MDKQELENIKLKTIKLLEDFPEWEDRYAGYIDDIKKHPTVKRRFRCPTGLSLYSSVSRREGRTFDSRFNGQSVAEITQTAKGITLYPKDKKNHEYFKLLPIGDSIPWEEAVEFRRHFKRMAQESNLPKVKSPEHQVENRLLKEFAKRSSNGKALLYIQPLTLYDCFFQMPTPLQASKHDPKYVGVSGGGIDIMARALIKSETSNWRLCIMEVKDENKPSESQSVAMLQAVTYATFIAKLLQSKSRQGWWDFFRGKLDYPVSIPMNIDIEVVTIMPSGMTDQADRIDLSVESGKENVPDIELHCHSLYYDQQPYNEGKFEFSGSFISMFKG